LEISFFWLTTVWFSYFWVLGLSVNAKSLHWLRGQEPKNIGNLLKLNSKIKTFQLIFGWLFLETFPNKLSEI
jgi:hypothetical protein